MRSIAPASLAVLIAALTAGSAQATYASTSSSSATISTAAKKVWIKDFRFSPATLTITVGTKVTWTNAGRATHTVTSKLGPRRFDSGDLRPGQTFRLRFKRPGVYHYFCRIHPFMKGEIVVRAQSTAFGRAGLHPSVPAASQPAAASAAPATATPAPAATAQAASVTIKDFAFSPASLTVVAGTKVTWENQDTAAHTATSTSNPKAFDSGDMPKGARFSFTFSQPGTYPYYCAYHPYMKATIMVTAATQ